MQMHELDKCVLDRSRSRCVGWRPLQPLLCPTSGSAPGTNIHACVYSWFGCAVSVPGSAFQCLGASASPVLDPCG